MAFSTEKLDTNHWTYNEFKDMGIACGRTIKRVIRSMQTLSKQMGASIASASADKAEAKAIYRLLANPKVTPSVLLQTHRKATMAHIKKREESVILVVQDTTTLNYTAHKKTEGLGDFGASPHHQGLLLHSAIAVTTDGIPLGLLDQFVWTRPVEERGKRTAKRQRPIEAKESYKWLKSMDNSCKNQPKGVRYVHVGDREADIYEFFQHALEKEQDFLVRVVQNRRTTEACKLVDAVKQTPPAGKICVEIPRDTRRNLPKRQATLAIRFKHVHMTAPMNGLKTPKQKATIAVSILHVREETPLSKSKPIEWYLITNRAVTTLEEAIEKVSWYIHRWKIERFHYILKSGCKIEEKQNRTAERLEKQLHVYSIIAVRILGMTYLARQQPTASCAPFLTEEEWQVLYRISNKTSTLPSVPPSIKEAVDSLAKMGGFLGRKADGDPGVKVLWRGFNRFYTVLEYYQHLLP
ncbi:IS4 family transposase [Lysinibacillus macroides]|nr:IS4 family transposase [Lysinibacillus macroides]QPR66515.1 IS4 family transposase [Lysinibacillus macroides]QPR67082.1 IS4 family transposase [Lysinibacillus macroides]QPR69702.1 IS4 family transposase [Lysinibacillus macroides]